MRTILAAPVIVIAMGSAANAAALGSAPAYAGITQNYVVCSYSNIGNSTINFTSSTILVEPGDAVTENFDGCAGPLVAGQGCRTTSAFTINSIAAHWCRAVVDNKAPLRGRMELRNSSGTVLSSEEIR